MKLLLLALLAPLIVALPPGKSTVTLTDEVISVRSVDKKPPGRSAGDQKIYTVHLYNKRIQPEAFGYGLLRCTFLGKGGVLGGGKSDCSGSYFLPRGSIRVSGTTQSRSFYRLSVIGGTGFYADGHGELIAVTVGTSPRRELLIFRLEAI